MRKIFEGKTKDVYMLDDGNYMLIFKDDMTGTDGIFDPGANTIGLSIEGAGQAGLAMSKYYFNLINTMGHSTHFISSEGNNMTVKPATSFGKGIEVICRYSAMGSFTRRYGDYINEGDPLDAVVEMTLKDDKRGDPLINEDALIAIGVLKPGEYSKIKTLTQETCEIIRVDLAEKGMELCDIKIEFGKDKDGKIMLIDEISGGNMRVMDNGKSIPPLELSKRVIQKG